MQSHIVQNSWLGTDEDDDEKSQNAQRSEDIARQNREAAAEADVDTQQRLGDVAGTGRDILSALGDIIKEASEWVAGGKVLGAIAGVFRNANTARTATGAVFKTTKEAAEAAKSLGFRKVNERVHGQAIFTDGKRFITRDVDGHNGGAWKVADSIDGLASKNTRAGTFDATLTYRIGD